MFFHVIKFSYWFVLLSLLPASSNAAGTTWFVSTSGTDSNTCGQAQRQGTPKRTIAAALSCVGAAGSTDGAGKTVQVASGNYSETLVDKIPSGTDSANRFTLKCEMDFACTNSLGTGSPALAHVGFNVKTQWVTIRGFIFDGGLGVYLSGRASNPHHDISLIDNEIRNAPNGMGIQASASLAINIIGNRIHDIGSGCRGYCHGIYPSDNTANWLIKQNEIYKISGYGIHLFADAVMPSNFVIQDNILHDNGVPGINGAGIIVYGSNHLIANNLSYRNAYEGILLRAVSNPRIYNNTTYKNGGAGINEESGSGAVCKNNLTIEDSGSGIPKCDSVSNNISAGTASSHFVNADTADFELVAGSKAIGAGVNLRPIVTDDITGTLRPTDSSYDAGAYQYRSLSRPVAPGKLKQTP